jgi:hypothetical protein
VTAAAVGRGVFEVADRRRGERTPDRAGELVA